MTKKQFDAYSFALGVGVTIIGIFILAWIYEYGQAFLNQNKEWISGLILGGTLVYCINKIDWEVGF